MKRWLNTALALVLVLAIAAGGFFLPQRGSPAAIRTRSFPSVPATSRVRPPFCA